MSIDSIINVLMWATAGIITVIVFILKWAQKIERDMASRKAQNEFDNLKQDGRLLRNEELIDHMMRAGEGIKARLDQNDLIIHELKTNFTYIKESIDDIKQTLKEKK